MASVLSSRAARAAVAEGSDTNVQATNDDAQVSKASCARHGYYEDPFIGYFVRKATRRSPLIHRGSLGPDVPSQVLSLGAGFDTTWFQLMAASKAPTRYVEVDFSEVTRRKVKIIQARPALRDLLGEDPGVSIDADTGSITSRQYSLLPVDLRELDGVQAALDKAGFDLTAPTLVLSECVLVYMDPTWSSALLRWLAARLPTAACVIYEQINPDDAFGRQMVSNLEMRGCPLKGLRSTPTLEAHRQRLLGCGWQAAAAADMDTIYRLHLDPAEKRRIEALEIFDEYEEWHMIQEHYCIAVGTNDQAGIFQSYGFGP